MDALGNWLIMSPLWVIGLTLLVGMSAFALFGLYMRRRSGTGDEKEKEGNDQEGLVVSAVMGLLALLVGFTFSMAIDRFDTRRVLVVEDAKAIESVYLRAQLLEEPHRARISGLLVAYTDNRILLGQERPGKRQAELFERNEQLLTELWSATVAAFPTMKSLDFSSSFIDSMTAVAENDAARLAARRAHVPVRVFVVLVLYQFAVAMVLGYVLVGRRGRRVAGFLLVLFGVALVLVIDIDRPTTGKINESQEPMIRLQETLHGWPPETFDRFNTPAPGP
jgi:hypothetical protein